MNFFYTDEQEDCDESREIDYPDATDVWWSDDEDYPGAESFFTSTYSIEFRPLRRTPRPLRKCKSTPLNTCKKLKTKIRHRPECVICLEPLAPAGASYCTYGCGNTFHTSCTVQLRRPQKCPLCRQFADFAKVSTSIKQHSILTTPPKEISS